jgi:hypothetical protein
LVFNTIGLRLKAALAGLVAGVIESVVFF